LKKPQVVWGQREPTKENGGGKREGKLSAIVGGKVDLKRVSPFKRI